MTEDKSMMVNTNRGWGDVAVDGLWPGIVGGVLMLVYLAAVGLLRGDSPAAVLAYFLPDDNLPVIAGLGVHLATSAVYGAIFSVLLGVVGRFRPRSLPYWGAGLVFGILLGLGAWLVVIPGGMLGLGAVPTRHLLVAHGLYGLGMGWVLGRDQ